MENNLARGEKRHPVENRGDQKKQKTGSGHRRNWRAKGGHQRFLCSGQRGFLCTTNFNEKNAVKEALNLLNEYGDSFTIKETTMSPEVPEGALVADPEETEDPNGLPHAANDIEDDITNELKQMRSADVQSKFYSVDTGVPNVVFVTTKIADPVGLVCKILTDIGETKSQKSRYLLRILPVEIVCKAAVPEMKTALSRILPTDLKTGFNSFQIVFKARYNNSISRTEVIKELAEIVMTTNSFNTVDLTNPKFTIIIEVLKGHCCLSVVTDYKKMKKFNLIEVSTGFGLV